MLRTLLTGAFKWATPCLRTNELNASANVPKDRLCHILAFVRLHGEGDELFLDSSEVYLLDKELIERNEMETNTLIVTKFPDVSEQSFSTSMRGEGITAGCSEWAVTQPLVDPDVILHFNRKS